VLTGVGSASLMLTAPGPAAVFVIGGAVLALIGLTWIAVNRPGQPSDLPDTKRLAPAE
jgi:hypothetical protein